MILVTLGTNDKSFVRLLQEIESLIEKQVICDEVVVQAGETAYHSDKMKIVKLLPMDEMEALNEKCDLLITHGGVGSIISGLRHGKRVIAVPRFAKYGEHVNDHQLQIVRNFNSIGCIIGIEDVTQLQNALEKAKSFIPQKYESNTKNMIQLVKHHIDA